MKLDISADFLILKTEVSRMQTQLNSEKCVKFARKFLIAAVSGIEFLNSRYDPLGLHLNGWSEHIMTTLGDFDSCFMRLYDKYRNTVTAIAPEIELLMILGGSATMFHLTQAFVSQNVPKFSEVAKESPDLAEKIANIMASKYNQKHDIEESSSDDDETGSLRGFSAREQNTPPLNLTEMLSKPEFPEMIKRMRDHPSELTTPMQQQPRMKQMKSKLDVIKEIDPEISPRVSRNLAPIKARSENVLVLDE
jgi:hypothetical protein